jgi:ketosteroid isomerase-like protein
VKATQDVEATVIAVLNEFNDAISARDLERVLALFAPDEDTFLMGSEAGEMATGPGELQELFRRIFARSGSFSWTWNSKLVSTAGSTAWVALDSVVHYSEASRVRNLPYRITAVLEQRGDKWLLAQFHGSEPAGSGL